MSDWAEVVDKIGKFIQTYGAWGICSFLLFILVALYYYMGHKHEKQLKDLSGILEKRNNQLISLIQRCSVVIANSAQAIESSSKTIEKTENTMKILSDDRKNIEELLKKASTLIEVSIYKK